MDDKMEFPDDTLKPTHNKWRRSGDLIFMFLESKNDKIIFLLSLN